MWCQDQAKISVGVAGFDEVGQGLVSGIHRNPRTKLAWIWDQGGLDDFELSEREKLPELKGFGTKGEIAAVGVCDGGALAEHGVALLAAADIVLCDAAPLADASLRQRLLDAAAGSGRQIRIAVNVDAEGFGDSGFKQKPKMPPVLFAKKEKEEDRYKREDQERRSSPSWAADLQRVALRGEVRSVTVTFTQPMAEVESALPNGGAFAALR